MINIYPEGEVIHEFYSNSSILFIYLFIRIKAFSLMGKIGGFVPQRIN